MSEKKDRDGGRIDHSQVGVVGKHAKIEGGIHFHHHYSGEPTRPAESSSPARSGIESNALRTSMAVPDQEALKVFISYAREDVESARRLYRDLKNAGAVPWLDEEDLLPGQRWRPAIRGAIKGSDYFIVLLSSNSVSKRGFVQAELKKALEVLEEFPSDGIFVIPVRLDDCAVNDETLNELNQVALFPDWETGLQRILKAIRPDAKLGSSEVFENTENPPEPRPYAIPSDFIQPGGAMDVDSRFYIHRLADRDVLAGVDRHRGMVTIRGPRQTGKTSLMLRLYANAQSLSSAFRPVLVDFQALSQKEFETLSAVWQAIVLEMAAQLNGEYPTEADWPSGANYDRNVSRFLDRSVFLREDTPVLLCLDEVDRVFSTPIREDFFSSVRSFYNRGAYDPAWKKIRWLLSTSSEPAFFIKDLNQSPFNVGIRISLNAINMEEIREFAHRYGISPDEALCSRILHYVGGRPYLVHLLLHHMALKTVNDEALFSAATAGGGIFKEHLDRYLAQFQEEPSLAAAMKRLIAGRGCDEIKLADRLEAAGLARKGQDGMLVCSCDLYSVYFEGKLHP